MKAGMKSFKPVTAAWLCEPKEVAGAVGAGSTEK